MKHMTFSVKEGEVVGILGENGAGKPHYYAPLRHYWSLLMEQSMLQALIQSKKQLKWRRNWGLIWRWDGTLWPFDGSWKPWILWEIIWFRSAWNQSKNWGFGKAIRDEAVHGSQGKRIFKRDEAKGGDCQNIDSWPWHYFVWRTDNRFRYHIE